MKRIKLFLSIFMLMCASIHVGCSHFSPPLNPSMEDRTAGWTAVVPTKLRLFFEEIDLPRCKDQYLSLLRAANAQPTFCADISTEDEAIEATIELLDELYDISVKRKDLHVFQGKYKQSWTVSSDSYVVVFDLSGELLAFVDLKTCDYLQPVPKKPDRIELQIDLAQISLSDLKLFNSALLGDTSGVREYLGDRFKKKTPSAEEAFHSAVTISQLYALRKEYSDEFRVYTNQANDAWLVLSNGWVAVFSQETGELLYFIDFNRHPTSDQSYKS